MKDSEWSKAFNIRLRGEARLRLDALCYALYEASKRSVKMSFQEGFRFFIMYPERCLSIEVRLYRCTACKKLYGSPWCWDHEDKYTKPEPLQPSPPSPPPSEE